MHPKIWASAGGWWSSGSVSGAPQQSPVAPPQWPQHCPVSLHPALPPGQDHPCGAQPSSWDMVRKFINQTRLQTCDRSSVEWIWHIEPVVVETIYCYGAAPAHNCSAGCVTRVDAVASQQTCIFLSHLWHKGSDSLVGKHCVWVYSVSRSTSLLLSVQWECFKWGIHLDC